ncbi:MAG: hypothetical protein R2932_11370 [Caldilineaceae bacterium]
MSGTLAGRGRLYWRRRVHQVLDEEKGRFSGLADGTQSIYLADLPVTA